MKIKALFFLGMLAAMALFPLIATADDDAAPAAAKEAQTTPKSELDNLKAEWEAVREQQVQMIREKEDQLEKLKEEIFSKMKTVNGPTVPSAGTGLETEKAALKAERQKFFAEMNRQKEKLRELQSVLDEKTKRLEAEQRRFEQEKKAAVR